MKKISLGVLVFSVMIVFASCSTDKCECTVNGQTQTITEDDISNGATLEEACDDSNAINQSTGTGSCKMV